jgi:hypothetical protein
MQFYITTWNHEARARDLLLDIILPLEAGLRDLGHTVERGEDPPRRDVTNVVIEYFPEWEAVTRLADLDYVLVGTEFPDGGGFNRSRKKSWATRYKNFRYLARRARAIWVVVDDAEAAYAEMAPAAQLSLGWSPSLEHPPAAEPPVFDLCAFGKMNVPRRQDALSKFSTRLQVAHMEYSSQAARDATLRKSMFCYGFRPHANVANASTSRIVAALMQGVPVLQERVAAPTPFVNQMEVVEGPDEVLARWDELVARRDDILQRQLAAWRAIPAAEVMAKAVAVMRPPPQVRASPLAKFAWLRPFFAR